nr:DUF4062 domain-containing protein [Psychrobacter sp. BI730]
MLVLDSLAIFFQARAFLTYDVSSKLSKASFYGRQCIDSCDYAVMIVGDSYGTVQKNGVSQMHLSYLNAKAKLKPLIVLVKNHSPDVVISRQLQEFIKLVTKQDNQLHYYDTEEDIEPLLVQAHYNAITNNKMIGGWVRANDEESTTSKKVVYEKTVDVLPSTTEVEKNSPNDEDFISDKVSEPIELTEFFEIQYSAQAYEGGNLTDVTRSLTLSWHEILMTLMRIPSTFSSYGLQNAINRLITAKAEVDIKKEMPNVHAVSRCQISQADINNLQRKLVGANWIQLMTYGTRVSQELWKLTFYAKYLLQNHTSNTNKQDE